MSRTVTSATRKIKKYFSSTMDQGKTPEDSGTHAFEFGSFRDDQVNDQTDHQIDNDQIIEGDNNLNESATGEGHNVDLEVGRITLSK